MGKLWEPRRYPPEKRKTRKWGQRIFGQTVASILIFLFIWGIFLIESPLVRPVQGKIRGWFSEDYSVEPVLKFFAEVGLWGDTFDQAAFEAMQQSQKKQKLSLTVPVSGQITRTAEEKEGILIAAVDGAPVRAALSGVIGRIANEEEHGRIVEVSSEDGIIITYGHCAEILVNLNDQVLEGQVIAKVGKTGKTLYPQLYLKIVQNGKVIDAVELFLPANVRA